MNNFTFEQYKDWFEFVQLKRSDSGVLEVKLHRNGSSLDMWGEDSISEVSLMFGIIGGDPDNRVIVLTGTGDYFIKAAPHDLPRSVQIPTTRWHLLDYYARRIQRNLLALEAPVIAAVNGPCNVHAEIPILSDIVIASDAAWFEDGRHFTVGVTPGDGLIIPWTALLGPNRARQFILMGTRLTAAQALEAGVVMEVLPQDQVLSRAHEIAAEFATRPSQVLRHTRILLTRQYRRTVELDQGYGAALEGLGAAEYWPAGHTQ